MTNRFYAALFVLPLAAFIFALLVAPMSLLIVESFRPAGGEGLALSNYREILTDSSYRTALLHSIGLSFGVAIASTLLCLPPAWLFVRYDFRGKRLMRALFTLPMSFSGIIVGFLVVIMIGRIGFVPQTTERLFGVPLLAGLSYKFWGLALAYLYFEVPRATLTLEAALRKFDFRIEAAARSLGASRVRRFFLVVLPLMRPALLSTFAVTFSVSLGSFGVALIVSKRFSVLGLEIFQVYTGMLNTPLAAAMSVTLALLALVVNMTMRWAFELEDGARA